MRIRNIIAGALALALMGTLAVGCAAEETDVQDSAGTEAVATDTEAPSFPVTVVDDAGREVTVESEPARIVSLAPANTEIVASLGLLDRLVGVTTYDDYPPEVADIDKIGDFITPNLEAIAAAQPDLVLATTGVQTDVLAQLEDLGAVVIAIDPQTLDGVSAAVRMVGDVTGASEAADEVVTEMRAAMDEIAAAIADEEPVTCFLEIAQDPLFTVGEGTLLHELIVAAGGTNVVAEPGYVAYSLEQLIADDPAVYLATLGSMSDPADLEGRAGYSDLTAVADGRVYVLEDNLVSRPGPRIVEGLRSIAEALHPDAF